MTTKDINTTIYTETIEDLRGKINSEKLKKNIEELRDELATIRTRPRPTTPLNMPIPEPENYTIIDLIFERDFDNDELLSFNMKEETLVKELRSDAARHFANEMVKLDAIQLDTIRKPYARRANHYRFITKIALKDER